MDLYQKETNGNVYLLSTSCHPKTTTLSIPYSLSLRIIKTCTKKEERDDRLSEMKELLLERKYPEDLMTGLIIKQRKYQDL